MVPVTSRGPSLHIYENTRVDNVTVKLKKSSLDFSAHSGQASITRRSSSLWSGTVSNGSDRSSEVFWDASESPAAGSSHERRSTEGSGSQSPSDDSPIPVCSSPVQQYCSGHCEPTSQTRPHVVSGVPRTLTPIKLKVCLRRVFKICVAACKDSQESWESDDGRSMTMVWTLQPAAVHVNNIVHCSTLVCRP